MKRVLMLTVLFTILCIGAAQAEWMYESVATAGEMGSRPSVAIDDEGIVHASWYDISNARLWYGYRDFMGWDAEVVATGGVGDYSSIAINPVTNLPAIAYRGGENARYAWYSEEDGWNLENITDSDKKRGEYIGLAFDSAGTPYVVYYFDDETFANDNGVRVATRTDSDGWVEEDVDIANREFPVGTHCAITMSSADYPYIAYLDDVWDYQKYGYKNSSGWNFETTISLEIAGKYADIALDSGDNIFISHYDPETVGEECVSVFVKTTGDWEREAFDCGGGDFGRYTSIAAGTDDLMRVSYVGDNDLRLATRSDTDDYGIVTLDTTGQEPKDTALALDGFDQAHILYYDAHDKDLRYAYDMPEPIIDSIDPATGLNTETLTGVTIAGSAFEADSEVSLTREGQTEIAATNVDVTSSQDLTCDLDLDGALVGNWTVTVTNAVGIGALEDGFLVATLAPELDSITPSQGTNNDTSYSVSLTGDYFVDPLTVSLSGPANVGASTVTISSEQSATATFDLTTANPGNYDVVVSTDFGTGTLDEGFGVVCGTPTAAFSADVVTGSAPLTVTFDNLSQGTRGCDLTDWTWDFGDGGTSADLAPQHVFNTPGTYTVTLEVTSAGGDDTETKEAYVTVTGDDDDDDDDDDLVDDDDDDSTRSGDDDDDDGCGC